MAGKKGDLQRARNVGDQGIKPDDFSGFGCGGGAKNDALMKKLRVELKDIEISISDKYGISSDFMEAMAFAWLAYKRVHKEKIDIKSVTGARDNSILGCVYE